MSNTAEVNRVGFHQGLGLRAILPAEKMERPLGVHQLHVVNAQSGSLL